MREGHGRTFTEQWLDENPAVFQMATELLRVYEYAENSKYPNVNRLQPRIKTTDVHNLIKNFGFAENIMGAVIFKLFSCSRSQFKVHNDQYRAYARLQRIDDPQTPRSPGRRNNQDRHRNRRPH